MDHLLLQHLLLNFKKFIQHVPVYPYDVHNKECRVENISDEELFEAINKYPSLINGKVENNNYKSVK